MRNLRRSTAKVEERNTLLTQQISHVKEVVSNLDGDITQLKSGNSEMRSKLFTLQKQLVEALVSIRWPGSRDCPRMGAYRALCPWQCCICARHALLYTARHQPCAELSHLPSLTLP